MLRFSSEIFACSCLTSIPAYVALTEALDKSIKVSIRSGHHNKMIAHSSSAPTPVKKSPKHSHSCSFGVHLPVCLKRRFPLHGPVFTAGYQSVCFKYILYDDVLRIQTIPYLDDHVSCSDGLLWKLVHQMLFDHFIRLSKRKQ